MYPGYDPAEQIKAMTERGGVVSLNDDASEDRALAVRFFVEPVKNHERSKKEGRLVCDDVEYCEIRIPGSQDIIRNVVSEIEKNRFPRQYAAFKASGDQDGVSGTPLRDWPLMTRSQVEEAAFFGIRTVEGMAEIPDSGLQRMGAGWLNLRKTAKDWLAKAKDGSLVARMRAELEERDRRLETLEKMLAKQAEQIQGAPAAGTDPTVKLLMEQVAALSAAISAKPPEPVVELAKRRGRPPKAKPEV